MTRSLTTDELLKHFIGFDNNITGFPYGKSPNFPPYNLIRHNDTNYSIEMALAGYDQDDINITEDKGLLVIEKASTDDGVSSDEYIHQGIANRSFKSVFRLMNDIVVAAATFENGILTISLERVEPKSSAKKISIS